ncbi:MAG: GNAT family N-acetyltransferase [Muribaculum sp.]
MSMQIIDPIPVELLEDELTPDKFLRNTNKGGNHIYIVDAHNSPNVMKEIGRLREIAFRNDGGGTGKACDIDEFDLMDPPCRQLIVWNPDEREIMGGYRFITGENIKFTSDGKPRIATSHMFDFSPRFIKEYLPHILELGRSWVRPEYQTSKAGPKALYALDNLWDGLGALTVVYPSVKYLFGKVTMYPSYNAECRNMILYFLTKHFPDPDRLVVPITPLTTHTDVEAMERMFTGTSFKEDYKILNKAIREHGYNIPPLVNAYMSLSPSMRMFGTAINDEFGDVEESGIFFAVSEIFEEKKGRHIGTYHAGDPMA